MFTNIRIKYSKDLQFIARTREIYMLVRVCFFCEVFRRILNFGSPKNENLLDYGNFLNKILRNFVIKKNTYIAPRNVTEN